MKKIFLITLILAATASCGKLTESNSAAPPNNHHECREELPDTLGMAEWF